jgi:hypothetical protein
VWAFIKNLAVADIEYWRKLSRYHGDIQPKLIEIAADGKLFFNDILNFTPHIEDGYRRMLSDKTYFSPLSPEALVDLNNNNQHPTFDKNKNEVFAIGITVLAVTTDTPNNLEGLKSFYRRNGNQWTVNQEVINSTIDKMVRLQKRSQTLASAFKILLAEKEADRPNLYQILEFLKVAAI